MFDVEFDGEFVFDCELFKDNGYWVVYVKLCLWLKFEMLL